MKTWEYRTGWRLNDEEINQMGIDGWELVSVIHMERSGATVFYFKREIK